MFKQEALHEEEARAFFDTLYRLDGEQRIELRWKPSGESGDMRRRFYGSKHEALQAALALKDDHDVYAGIAPRQGEVGTKEGVTHLPVIWADLDAKNGHTRESRLQQLMGLPYLPSMLVWSGAGWHVYWLLRVPVEGRENLNQAQMIMQRLAEGLGGDPVHDLPRILRVPGSYNHKYEEPRPVRLVDHYPDKRYTLDQLQEMAEALPEALPTAEKASGNSKVARDVLSAPIRDGQRNIVLASVGGSLRDRGLDEETIYVILLEVNRLRCEPPLRELEVYRVTKFVSRYACGSPRYRRSPTRRTYPRRRHTNG